MKGSAAALAAVLLLSGCSSIKNTWDGMSQTGQGATAGGTIGAAVGTGVGALIGGGKGTRIGALVGGARWVQEQVLWSATIWTNRRKRSKSSSQMQDQENRNSQDIQDIKVQMVKDRNDLDAIKLVLGDAVLFPDRQKQSFRSRRCHAQPSRI